MKKITAPVEARQVSPVSSREESVEQSAGGGEGRDALNKLYEASNLCRSLCN